MQEQAEINKRMPSEISEMEIQHCKGDKIVRNTDMEVEEEEEEEEEETISEMELSKEGEDLSALTVSSSSFPDEVLEHVLAFVTSHRDRNAVSLVCRAWYRAEAWSRRSVYVGNCYACSPQFMALRFPRIKSLTLKGKPHFADFNLVPPNWGADVSSWICELARSGPFLEELRLKRMIVTDASLVLLAQCFPNFRALVLTLCEGFSTEGLAVIASNCRHLSELDLEECSIDDRGGNWLSAFPEACTSLTSLNFTSLISEVNFEDLERLVSRCSNLKRLKLNRNITLDELRRLLVVSAPNLTELGTGSFIQDVHGARMGELENVFSKCKNLRTLSGFWAVAPLCLSVIYPVCCNLTFLNLSFSPIRSSEFSKLIRHCQILERLWVQDLVEDKGLQEAARACKNLRELRVLPTDSENCRVTENGLVAISEGCGELRYVLYFCNQMTNAALQAVARNCPNMTHFRLCVMRPREPDYTTREAMDEGFGAVASMCANLRRLSVSGLLTDRAFELIGKHAKELRCLSVAFAGNSGAAMAHVLGGCCKLRKLEIRDSPFGDSGLLAGLQRQRYYAMRSLWMSACGVSAAACRRLARLMPLLNVEIILDDEEGAPSPLLVHTDADADAHSNGAADDEAHMRVDKLYLYRSVAGPRGDAPAFVHTL